MERVKDNIYRERNENGKFRYFLRVKCQVCGKYFFTDKYHPSAYCSNRCKGNSRGRPIGHKLSDADKENIAQGMIGHKVSAESKEKISESMKEAVKSGLFHKYLDGVSGAAHPVYVHGKSNSDTYSRWLSLKSRCYNPNSNDYKYYGAKGVKLGGGWNNFLVFDKWAEENGFDKSKKISRIDSEGDYCPENCIIRG